MDKEYKRLFRHFDRECQARLDKIYTKFNTACQKVEDKIKRVELSSARYINRVLEKSAVDVDFAEGLIQKELKTKVIISQWINYFLCENDSSTLDPISYSIIRWCLNIALCYSEVTPEYLQLYDVHKKLIFYCSSSNDIIAGPAYLALSHVSLIPSLKHEIVVSNILPICLKTLAHGHSVPIITYVCKLLASLALYRSNKLQIANSGCLHALIDLILQHNKKVFSVDVQYATLTAIVNSTYGCDANRQYMSELNGIIPLLQTIKTTSNHAIMLEAIKALVNMAFTSKYVSGCILSDGGDIILVEVLQGCDILRQPLLAHSALAALANFCTYAPTQTHVGHTEGLIEVTVLIIKHTKQAFVVAQAAALLLAIMWKNMANKIRVGTKNACAALVQRIVEQSVDLSDESLHCLERLCHALATFCLLTPNQEIMKLAHGTKELVSVVKKTSNDHLLRSLSTVLCVLVPSPDDLLRYHNEEYCCEVEKFNALPALKKCRLSGFGTTGIPEYLESSIRYLSLSDEGLAREKPWTKTEYVNDLYYMQELVTEIKPDSTILSNSDLQGLIFTLF